MVLFVPSPCISAPSASPDPSSFLYEVSTCSSTRNTSKPVPLRSSFSRVDASSFDDCPLFSSPLSSSAESISSIKSNCSSRSYAEREAERAEKKELLNMSLAKIRSNANLPLRKHLFVYNSIKQLQRELDLLDDEELYCSLMGVSADRNSLEVNERRWLAPLAQAAPPAAAPAPPVAEERAAPPAASDSVMVPATTTYTDDDVMMADMGDTWSWSTTNTKDTQRAPKLFESIQDVLDGSFSGWGWNGGSGSGVSGGSDDWASAATSAWQPLGDLADPFANSLSRFELQHLFPSQLLLQA